MASIIQQFNAKGLKYTFTSSGAKKGYPEENAFSESPFYSDSNTPSYWQITFSHPVIAESYQICTKNPILESLYVKRWNVSYSTEISLKFLQTDEVSSSGRSRANNFSFSKPIPLKSLRITSKSVLFNGQFLSVSQFDLFGIIRTKKRHSKSWANSAKNKKQYNNSNDATNNIMNKKKV